MYNKGDTVKLKRQFTNAEELHPGDICMIYRDEGLGCYILKSKKGTLFAAKESEIEPLGEDGSL